MSDYTDDIDDLMAQPCEGCGEPMIDCTCSEDEAEDETLLDR